MTQKKSIFRRILNVIYLCIMGIIIVFAVFCIVVKSSGGIPNIFGYNIQCVVTPSMTPTIEVNDVLISKVYDENTELKVDDIITYHGLEGDMAGKLITHRIIAIDTSSGSMVITTKGDANSVSDPTISTSQVISVVCYKTVVLSFVYHIFSSNIGFILIFILLALLMISETKTLIEAIRRKGEKHENTSTENQTEISK